ncbi:MFS transporter [Anatilimnocola floriformis]|uniref:MFS transporter n=1 Tax=Anatilimnocola floriformis TaxID=2948575 RepID=UPI0020C33BF0|nr:MFS transporter [Anatilimnocola floriformis]
MSLATLEPTPALAATVTDAPRAKTQSERALDALTFFLADVADGLGPFLAIYVTSTRGWTSGEAGMAMAAMLLGTILSQTFVGAWIDRLRAKRMAIVGAAVLVATCCVVMYYLPLRSVIFGSQFLAGVAVTVFPPAIAAISLGLVGRRRLATRVGRNEGFNHGGNVCAAALAAGLSYAFGSGGVFYGVAAMALASAIATTFIREEDIDHNLARGADAEDGETEVVSLSQLFSDSRIWWFTTAVVLFHFANAAMLPLVGQKVSVNYKETAAIWMAACIIVAQFVMVPVAIFAGNHIDTWGRRAIFLIGFSVLPIRGLLYTLTDNPALLIANQILDGIGAGIFGVAAVVMVADLTRGTGRFNFLQGLIATAVGLGAAASNLLTGFLVDAFGFNAGFIFLSAIALVSLAVFFLRVMDTRESGLLNADRPA